MSASLLDDLDQPSLLDQVAELTVPVLVLHAPLEFFDRHLGG